MKKYNLIIILLAVIIVNVAIALIEGNEERYYQFNDTYYQDVNIEDYQYCTGHVIIYEGNTSDARYITIAVDKELKKYEAQLEFFNILSQHYEFDEDMSYSIKCDAELLFKEEVQ